MNKRNSKQHIKLILHASSLKNVSSAFSKSSPFAVVTQLAGFGTSEEPKILGRTEVMSNTLSPQWTNAITIKDFELGQELFVQVDIYDNNSAKRGIMKSMGSTKFEIGCILGQKHNRSAKRLRNGGTIYAIVDRISPPSLQSVKCTISASMKSKENSYYEIHRRDMFASGALWTPIYRSEIVKMGKKPRWNEFSLPMSEFGKTIDNPVRILVWAHSRTLRHKLLGERESTLKGLLDASVSNVTLNLTKNSEEVVEKSWIVVSARVEGDDSENDTTFNSSVMTKTLYTPESSLRPAIPVSPPKPTFVDYITGGCELDLCVAIDFTASNGDPRIPGSPHDITSNSLNEYEKAILAIGGIISKYDTNQKYPVWGFGAKYGGVTRHVFQVGDIAEVDGVGGILHAYRTTFEKGVTMSSPVVFTDVIKVAAKRALRKLDTALQNQTQSYTILLILTHGCVSDKEATCTVLNSVSKSPLSVIIVGVGENDFSTMRFLDDFQMQKGGRDICNFVKFTSKLHKSELTRATLNEVPKQLESYFLNRNIFPNPSDQANDDDESLVIPQSKSEHDNECTPLHVYDSDGELQIESQDHAYYRNDMEWSNSTNWH